ncbi:MAG: putative manganese-dependent inorganic diphosphatase [Bacilli bacterium]
MEKTYIFGHKKPDTDSVTSAITLAYLKNCLGVKATPMVLGNINPETKFVLDYFKVEEPKYLNNVRLEIKDVNYHKGYMINENTSIINAYKYMTNRNITGVPLIDSNTTLTGLITEKMLVKELVEGEFTKLSTTYKNIIETLNGQSILETSQEIKGNIVVASYRSTTFLNNVKLNKDDILIVGDRHSIIEYAVNSGVKLIIIVGNGEIKEEHLNIALKNNVNIIRTSYDTFHTTKLIGLSNPAKSVIKDNHPISFLENTPYNDFLEESRTLKHNNYPIIDKCNKCLGLIRVTDITSKNKKQVILVDHNEAEQSVNGLEEANIMEIVDHHKLGDLTTSSPINFRNMAVGSTNTIIYFLYKENQVEIPYEMAGLMLSGILSDTLNLTSPTATELDIKVVKDLTLLTGIDPSTYALTMLKAGTSFQNKTKEEIILMDFKVFPLASEKIAVSQVFTFNTSKVLKDKEEYLKVINELVIKNDYDAVILAITNILENGSYILYTKEIETTLKIGYNLDSIEEGFFLPGCVSRKKQIIPVLVDTMENK